MKKDLCFLLLVGILIFSLLCTCKKKAVDRRNKYIGFWLFNYTVRSTSLGNSKLITSGEYRGKIYYDGRKDKEHRIHFELSKDWEEEFEIDKKNAGSL